MSVQDQMELAKAPSAKKEADASDSAPKTILVHVQNDETIDARLESALSLARAYSAHLECLHVTPIQAYVAYDGFGGVFVMDKVMDALDEQEKALRTKFEAKLGNEDVSWDYQEVTGDIPSQLVSHAALADLVVTGREPHRSDYVGSTVGLLGDLISRSRTPLFIPGQGGSSFDPMGAALIAWDNSYEAANAVRSTIGMLKQASKVDVVRIEEKKDETFPSTRLLEYLSRHGVHAELTIEPVEEMRAVKEFVPDMLIARAHSANASYMVMGGYSHSRVGEYIFGGVTRSILSASPIAIVIAG
jgi:nucleotide-binding universal stress UspA family protein